MNESLDFAKKIIRDSSLKMASSSVVILHSERPGSEAYFQHGSVTLFRMLNEYFAVTASSIITPEKGVRYFITIDEDENYIESYDRIYLDIPINNPSKDPIAVYHLPFLEKRLSPGSALPFPLGLNSSKYQVLELKTMFIAGFPSKHLEDLYVEPLLIPYLSENDDKEHNCFLEDDSFLGYEKFTPETAAQYAEGCEGCLLFGYDDPAEIIPVGIVIDPPAGTEHEGFICSWPMAAAHKYIRRKLDELLPSSRMKS